jgi:hypothetical protein
VKAFSRSTRQSSQAFQLLDRDLQASRATVTRLMGASGLRAILVRLAALRSQSQNFVAQVQTAEDPPEDTAILFVSSGDAASEMKSLVAIVGSVPDWIAVPDAPAGGFEIHDTVVHPTGSVRSRDEEQKRLSFALYPLEPGAMKEARSIQPVKAKIPEPEQNLQQRGRWFNNRRKRR